jgi:class 3 adenylate cyclase
MDLGLVLSGILLIASIILVIRLVFNQKKVEELKSKTDFALKGDDVMKIAFKLDSNLGKVASNFNTLVDKYQGIKGESADLLEDRKKKETLDSKVKEFEESFSQITLLTDIGKQITGSLNVEEILRTVHKYIKASMDLDELELLFYKNGHSEYLSIGKGNEIEKHQLSPELEVSNVMNWTLENRKEVFLNDAKKDYTQYLYNPVKSFTNKEPSALICIPLYLHNKKVGAIGVTSQNKEVYNSYHLEFLRTLASYLSVALDNSNIYKLLESGKEQIEEEKSKSDDLLKNILPSEIAEELKEKGSAEARDFEMTSILFTDFKEFTAISQKMSAQGLVAEIHTCFEAFDQIVQKYNIEKIKTIGDSYMAAGGIPVFNKDSTKNTVLAAIEMNNFMIKRKELREKDGEFSFEMRSGVHSGPVVAGIVGVKKFQYDIWGDTVNTASRVESAGEAGKVNISSTTYEIIKDEPEFVFEERGIINVKGKGSLEMYFVSKS